MSSVNSEEKTPDGTFEEKTEAAIAADAKLARRLRAKKRWRKKRLRTDLKKGAVGGAVKTAQASLTARNEGLSVKLDYADHLKDDLSSDILFEDFLFLVDTATGAGLLCEYTSEMGWNTAGNYKQMYLSKEDVSLLKKSTGIIPNYLSLGEDMKKAPENIMGNLATLTMLKTLNLFKRVNADAKDQRDMLERFIEDRTGRAVSVNTSDAERSAERDPAADLRNERKELQKLIGQVTQERDELERTQRSNEEQIFISMFAQTQEFADKEFEFALGFLKADTFLYTWENRNSYMPAFFATKGTTFKKGTVVLRSFKKGEYDRIVVIDARDYDDIIDGTGEIGLGSTEQKILVEDENVRYAAKPGDIKYVDDLNDPRTRFMLLYKLVSKRSGYDGFSRWSSLLVDAETIEVNAKEAAEKEDAAQKAAIAEKKELREEFDIVKSEQADKLNELIERIKPLENVTIGRIKMRMKREDGGKGDVRAQTLVLVVGKDTRDEYVDELATADRFDFMTANPKKKVGERTWYSTFFIDRRKTQFDDTFSAHYSNLTVPYAAGKAKETLKRLYEDQAYDSGEKKVHFVKSLKDLRSQEFPEEFLELANIDTLTISTAMSMNPAAFDEFTGVMTSRERRSYGGGENESFNGYMNGIDFANFFLDEIDEKKKLEQRKDGEQAATETGEQAAAETGEPAATKTGEPAATETGEPAATKTGELAAKGGLFLQFQPDQSVWVEDDTNSLIDPDSPLIQNPKGVPARIYDPKLQLFLPEKGTDNQEIETKFYKRNDLGQILYKLMHKSKDKILHLNVEGPKRRKRQWFPQEWIKVRDKTKVPPAEERTEAPAAEAEAPAAEAEAPAAEAEAPAAEAEAPAAEAEAEGQASAGDKKETKDSDGYWTPEMTATLARAYARDEAEEEKFKKNFKELNKKSKAEGYHVGILKHETIIKKSFKGTLKDVGTLPEDTVVLCTKRDYLPKKWGENICDIRLIDPRDDHKPITEKKFSKSKQFFADKKGIYRRSKTYISHDFPDEEDGFIPSIYKAWKNSGKVSDALDMWDQALKDLAEKKQEAAKAPAEEQAPAKEQRTAGETDEPDPDEFEKADQDQNNVVSQNELAAFLEANDNFPGMAFVFMERYDKNKDGKLNSEEFATLLQSASFKKSAKKAADQHADYRVDGKVAQWLEGESTENEAVFNIFNEGNEIERLEITLDEAAKERIEFWDSIVGQWSEIESLEQFKTEVIDELDD